MARIDVIMPQMGESITEGTMSRWMKKVGDAVKRDEPIFEISTDKVDAEIPAPNAGVLAEVIVTEGQTVAVGTVVARIETEAGAAGAPSPAQPAPASRCPAAAARRSAGAQPAAAQAPAPQGATPQAAAPPPPPARRHLRPTARWRRSRYRNRRGTTQAQVDAARPQDGRGTPPRSRGDSRQRIGRPGDQAGCAELPGGGAAQRPRQPHPRRRRRLSRRLPNPPATARRSRHPDADRVCRRRWPPGKAIAWNRGPDPQAHRRSHGAVAPRVGARQFADRDRLQSRGDVAQAVQARVTPSAAST